MAELFDAAALADAAYDPGRYVERYRFSPLLVVALTGFGAMGGVSAGFAFVGAREIAIEHPTAMADIAVLGAGEAAFVVIAVAVAVFVSRWVYAAATHQLAFRADRDGITLGSQPYPPTRQVTVPWSDLARIEVSSSSAPVARTVVLTVRRDAPRPRGIPRRGTVHGAVRRFRVWWNYNASGDVGRYMQGWALVGIRLEAVVMTYAPRVWLINL
jgi:hypothetical protein